MNCVLLVYGSRALSDAVEAREWARERIVQSVGILPEDSTVLSGGCADSPDEWAREIVAKHCRDRLTMLEFRLDGFKWRNGEPTEESWLNLAPPGAERDRGTARWPLRRNDAMAMAILRAHIKRWVAGSFGLRAPWTTTGGTDYQTNKLKDAPWSVLSCPVDYGPKDSVEAMCRRTEAGRGRW